MSHSGASVAEGRTISHYRIVKKLGGGGMGVVYKAEDLRLNRFVALKFLSPHLTQSETAKRRFVREAQAASALDHQNICGVHDIEETAHGQLFICMPYYEGETLDRRLARGSMPVNEAVGIVTKIAAGLAHAHAQGIIHRDIKPGNVMLTRDGGLRILDFGLAKLRGVTRITRTGATTMGTCDYMSPEQILGAEVDIRSDIFSLGVVLYELLAGRTPFKADHSEAVMYQIVHNQPRPLKELRPQVTPRLQHIVDRALNKSIADRYRTADEMQADLEALLTRRLPEWVKIPRRYRGLATVTAIAVALAGATLVFPWSRGRIARLFDRVPEHMHVSVLPFENVGNDPLNQAFCDGLTETLTAQLSQLAQYRDRLWVVPATEVRAAKIRTPVRARDVLGANLVVTGAVQRFGDHFRVTLNLIDSASGDAPRQLDAAVIDNSIERVVTLQDETMMRMAAMMDMRLHPQEERVVSAGGTQASQAYDFYLQGLGYVRNYEIAGNLDRAIEAFSLAIERDSVYALAWAGLGEAYWRKYRDTTDSRWVEPAVTAGRRAVEIDSTVSAARIALATTLAGTGKPGDAIREFKHVLAFEPGNTLAMRGLANACATAGQQAEAEAAYRNAIAAEPDYWGVYNDFGNYCYARGRYELALEQHRKVILLTPHNQFGYNNAGACYWALDDLDSAREMFQRSIEAEPNFRAYSNLGALYYMSGSYSESARMCEEALELNDASYRSWANLANAYFWVPGKREEAMEAYRRAVALAETQRALTPADPNLLCSLAGYYAILGDVPQTVSTIDQAIALEPGNPRVEYFCGHACEQIGRRDDAFKYIGRAIENGYPVSEVARDPWLHQFRKDPRYESLVRGAPRSR